MHAAEICSENYYVDLQRSKIPKAQAKDLALRNVFLNVWLVCTSDMVTILTRCCYMSDTNC